MARVEGSTMGRGPSYPYVGLEESIGLARKMYEYTKRAPADISSVVSEAWKYSPSSSSGQKVAAALKSFGLIEEGAGASGKTIKLTPRAIRILLDHGDSEERRKEIRAAALSPNWYARCWKTWGKEMPSSMRSSLLINEGFVDTTVDGFLRDYRKTLAFAGILDEVSERETGESSDILQEPGKDSNNLDMQFETQGARNLHFVPKNVVIASAPPPTKVNSDMRTETFSLPDGISISVQWPPSITPDAVEDFEDYLKSLVKRIKRASFDPAKVESQDGRSD
jgi:hypothetical protein